MKCPNCDDGKYEMKVTTIDCITKEVTHSSFMTTCELCKGTGIRDVKAEKEWEEALSIFCDCGNPSGDVWAQPCYPNTHSVDTMCSDCNKILVVG